MKDEEKLPVSEVLKVIESANIYKTEKWWSAIVLLESYGRRQVAVYVWNNRNGEWKRRQKFVITRKQQWEKVKPKIEEFISKL